MDDNTMSSFGIQALHDFELPFTESNNEHVSSSLSCPLTPQAGGNLSTCPSEIVSGPENATQSVKMDKITGLETLEIEQQKGLEKKERRKLINPNKFEQSAHYTSFSPKQTLNMLVVGLDSILEDKNGNVFLKGVPHRIIKKQ